MLFPVSLDSSAVDGFEDAEARRGALTSALALPAPSAEAEEWRYGPIGDLDLSRYTPRPTAPAGEAAVVPAGGSVVESPAAVVTVVDGHVVSIDLDAGWAAKGLTVESVPLAIDPIEDPDRIDGLHAALAPSTLSISVTKNVAVTAPVVVLSHHTGGGAASFAHSRVVVGANAELAVIERQTSAAGPGLSVPLVDIEVGDAARVQHTTVQELGAEIWQLGRQRSEVGAQATLTSGIAAFGGAYARVRTDTNLSGQGATGELLAVYYGDEKQVLDFRTFQHHRGANTQSDLLFKGTVDDGAGSIYTGLIQIHPDARGSNAHQTNRNVKLSEDAWAWSVPNLEIENNDVRCSHASTVSPVDADQRFYLHARGVPPTVADRLIVAGFFDEVIGRFAHEGVRTEVRRLINAKLDTRVVAEVSP